MKFAIIGAGSVGSIFAAQLYRAGNEVTFIEKFPDISALINEKGLYVQGVLGEYNVTPKSTTNAADVGQVDVVLVCVKAYDTEKAIREHAAVVNEDTAVVTLQNGYGNVDILCDVAGTEKVIGGTTAQGGYLKEPGVLFHAGNGPTVIGEVSGEVTARIKSIAETFNEAGIATEISGDVNALIWTKLIINVGLNPLTALLRVTNGLTSELENSRSVQKAAVAEALAVAKAAGVNIDPESVAKKVVEVAQVTFENINSMLSDTRKQSRTEIDYINGAVAKLGRELGIPTPVNDTLTNLIRATEESYGRTVE